MKLIINLNVNIHINFTPKQLAQSHLTGDKRKYLVIKNDLFFPTKFWLLFQYTYLEHVYTYIETIYSELL